MQSNSPFRSAAPAAWLAAFTALATASLWAPLEASIAGGLALIGVCWLQREAISLPLRRLTPLMLIVLLLALISVGVAEHPGRALKGSFNWLRALALAVPVAVCLALDPARFRAMLARLAALLARVAAGLLLAGQIDPAVDSRIAVVLLHPVLAAPTGVVIAYWLVSYGRSGNPARPGAGFGIALDLCLLAGLLTMLASTGPSLLPPAIEAAFVSRNVLASALSLPLLLLAAGTIDARGHGERLSLALTATVAGLLVIATGSRGAVLALLLSAPILLALRGIGLRPLLALVYAGIALSGAGLLYMAVAASADLSSPLLHNGSIDNGRLPVYMQTLGAIAERPWFGWGLNNFKVSPFNVVNGQAMGHPHSIYLELLFSVGVFGVAALAAVLTLTLSRLPAAGTSPRPWGTVLGHALMAWVAARGFFDLTLFSYANAAQLGLALGCLMGAATPAQAGATAAPGGARN